MNIDELVNMGIVFGTIFLIYLFIKYILQTQGVDFGGVEFK